MENNNKNDEKKVYWHLPGFCRFFGLNRLICYYFKYKPEFFREGYAVGSVYGTFPGAIWNGGRAVFGTCTDEQIKSVIQAFNDLDVPVRFTWTNSILEEKHVTDEYCNRIMHYADNGKNQVLVNTKVLEDYLKKNFPNFEFISSTTKRLTNVEDVRAELEKGYLLVVLDYDLNHNEEILKELEPEADRIELLVDEICFPNCPLRKKHYADESKAQIENDTKSRFHCPNREKRPCFAESMKRPAFIGNDDIGKYIDRGYRNFKLVGRGLPFDMVLDSYIYYLIKEEYQKQVRAEILRLLGDNAR